eukprot:COSAG02_NODE_815_length_16868_cov_8.101258_11_plen_198_part_00
MVCVENKMCEQPAPFLCSEEFALISHVRVGAAGGDLSNGAAEGSATPDPDDPNTAKFSDSQINSWVTAYGHENIIFKVVMDGSDATARYYRFDSPLQQYTSTLFNYAHVCASMQETVGFVCGPERIYDNNPNWWGLSSVMNRGIQDATGTSTPCPSGEGGDGFHGIANQPPQVYDRCANNQGSTTGTVDTYMKILRG